MRVHLVNPSDVSFGIGVITPRWLFVLAAATPPCYGDPILTDETLEQFVPGRVEKGDVVGIGIHTGNAMRGLAVGRTARERGAWVVYGGIHATLYPEEALNLGAAHAVVKGDGDVVWSKVLADCAAGTPESIYDGGRISADRFLPARWDLSPPEVTCGRRCKPCGAVRSTVPSARSGAPMGSSRGSAPPIPSWRRSSNSGAWAIDSSRWRMTTSTRSR